MRILRVLLVALAGFALALPTAGQPDLGDCPVGSGLGSTLLYPYFEVDLSNLNGVTTLISVNNGKSTQTLARVILWTDWGVPTLGFDVFLLGFDVQTINLRHIFDGNIPSTGEGVDRSAFEYCQFLHPPTHANPVLHPIEQAQLAADHTGQLGPYFGDCAGENHGDQIARGYITADVVDECGRVQAALADGPWVGPHDPIDIPYFENGGGSGGVAIADNRIWGDIIYVDSVNNSAQGIEAIPIWSDPSQFSGTDVFTFYGRFSGWDGRDERVPLPYFWNQRFLNGGPFAGGADLIVWRDTGGPVEFSDCGNRPSWWPLLTVATVTRDEDAQQFFAASNAAFPLATQRVDVGSLGIPYDFGRIQIRSDLGMWVQPTLKAGGLFSAAYNGSAVQTMCDKTPSVVLGPSRVTSASRPAPSSLVRQRRTAPQAE